MKETNKMRYGTVSVYVSHIGIIKLGIIAIGITNIHFFDVTFLNKLIVKVVNTPAKKPNIPLMISPPNSILDSIFAIPSGKQRKG